MNLDLNQPHVKLAIMSRWYVVSRALQTVAKLGLANHMSFEPRSVTELAQLTDTKPELLLRLLTFLSAYELFHQQQDSFALTPLSLPLRDDHSYSMRDVLCMVDESWWESFAALETSLKTGEPAFKLQHGDDFFSYLSKHPVKQSNFDQGMAKLSTYDEIAIAQAYPFSRFKHLVDMGGGRGGLSKAIAKHYPNISLTLFDSPAVINQLNHEHYPIQINFQAGNFLAAIPQADAYLFKGVLHDFNDALMHQILANCRQQMPANASLFIAEQIIPNEAGPHPNKTMDIVMMVLLGGRQRTLTEWQKSIEPSGFVYQQHYATNSIFTLLEFRPFSLL